MPEFPPSDQEEHDATDRYLLDKIAWSDGPQQEAAYEQFFQRYLDPVRNFVQQRFVTRNEDAEEIASETLLKVWHGAHTFEGGSKVKTWVFAIATRAALSTLRAQKRHPELPYDQLDQVTPLEDPGSGPERSALDKVTAQAILTSLEPRLQRYC